MLRIESTLEDIVYGYEPQDSDPFVFLCWKDWQLVSRTYDPYAEGGCLSDESAEVQLMFMEFILCSEGRI